MSAVDHFHCRSLEKGAAAAFVAIPRCGMSNAVSKNTLQIFHQVEHMQGIIERFLKRSFEQALEVQAGAVLLGPRQIGKTTLAQVIAEIRDAVYLDMERTADRRVLDEPDLYLEEQAGRLVVIDGCIWCQTCSSNCVAKLIGDTGKGAEPGNSFWWGPLQGHFFTKVRSRWQDGSAITNSCHSLCRKRVPRRCRHSGSAADFPRASWRETTGPA